MKVKLIRECHQFLGAGHSQKLFVFQIEDIKLIRDHETGRSQGYGFITVSQYKFV